MKEETTKSSGIHNKDTKKKSADKEEENMKDTVVLARAHAVKTKEEIWLAHHMAHNKSILENMRKAEMSHITLGDLSQ